MKLSLAQNRAFWVGHKNRRTGKWQPGWRAVVKQYGWDDAEADAQRKLLLDRAGFTSLKDVDPVDGFTRVLQELAALANPAADLNAVLQYTKQANDRRNLEWDFLNSQERFHPLIEANYIAKIIHDQWLIIAFDEQHRLDLSELSLHQLDCLRSTLETRASELRASVADSPDPADADPGDVISASERESWDLGELAAAQAASASASEPADDDTPF